MTKAQGGEEDASYWWNEPGIKKRDLINLPNGWVRIHMHKKAIMSDWLFYAQHGNRPKSDECRDAIKEIDAILVSMETCMKKHGIGFIKEPPRDE